MLVLTLAIFVLNSVAFGVQALAPVFYRLRGRVAPDLLARVYVLADLQASVVVLALLWLALLRPL